MLRAEESRLRTRVDDGTAILEMWHGCLGHVEVAVEIRAHRHVELLFRDFFDRFGMTLEGCVVHQDVESAELVDRVVDRVLAEGRVADIACDRDAASTLGFDLAAGLPGIGVFAQVDDRHIRTLAGEEDCHRAANARISTGDERNHSLELAAAYIGRRLIVWLRRHLVLGTWLREMLLGHRAVRLRAVAGLHGFLSRGIRPGLLRGLLRFRALRFRFPGVITIDPLLDLALLAGGLLCHRAISIEPAGGFGRRRFGSIGTVPAPPPLRTLVPVTHCHCCRSAELLHPWSDNHPCSDHITLATGRMDVDRRRDRASVASYARARCRLATDTITGALLDGRRFSCHIRSWQLNTRMQQCPRKPLDRPSAGARPRARTGCGFRASWIHAGSAS